MQTLQPAIQGRYRLGPDGLVYVVVTALLLWAANYTQANLLFWAFGLLVGGLVISVGVSWVMLAGLTVQRLPLGHGVAGQPLALRYLVTNTKTMAPAFNLVISESWPRASVWRRLIRWFRGEASPKAPTPLTGPSAALAGPPLGWVLHIGPGQTVQAEAPCWPQVRGPLTFERIEISTAFPFGALRRVLAIPQPGQVIVYPQLHRVDRQVLSTVSRADVSGMQRMQRAGGQEEFYGLRPYRLGDTIKMIDWKRSARSGELVAREMTLPSPPKVMIALDLTGRPGGDAAPAGAGRPGVQPDDAKPVEGKAEQADAPSSQMLIEQAISLTASLICDAHLRGFHTGLIVLGADCQVFPLHHSLSHRTRMLEALTLLDMDAPRLPSVGAPPTAPSVIVRAFDQGDESTLPAAFQRGPKPRLLLASAFHRYLAQPPHEPSWDPLARRVIPPSQRAAAAPAAVAG